MNIGDKLPEILGVDQNGQEVRTSEYAGRKSDSLFLSQRSNSWLHGWGMLSSRQLQRTHPDGIWSDWCKVLIALRATRSSLQLMSYPSVSLPIPTKPSSTPWECGERRTVNGKITVGHLRTTFHIDEEGKVESIFTPGQIRTKEHAAQIIKRVKG